MADQDYGTNQGGGEVVKKPQLIYYNFSTINIFKDSEIFLFVKKKKTFMIKPILL